MLKPPFILSQAMILKQPICLSPRMFFKILLLPIFATAYSWRCQDFQLHPNGQCNKFIRCIGHIPVVMACPTNTKFNEFLKVCDWPYNVVCISSTAATTVISRGTTPIATRKTSTWRPPPITTTPYVPTGVSPGETFACPTNIVWGLFPDYKSNCKYYFECQLGRSRHIACPQDLVFNTLTLNCNRPENSECGPHIYCPSYLRWARQVDRASGCKRYYECNYGTIHLFSCPADLLFNDFTKVCDLSFNVKC